MELPLRGRGSSLLLPLPPSINISITRCTRLYIFLITILNLIIPHLNPQHLVNARPQKSCNRERKIIGQLQGVISDGPDNYHNNSHCEWLIQAPPGPHRFITLHITSLKTECAFDHLSIYDGDSYTNATLIATLSGSTQPPLFTASSGSMLILLYSDTNYVLDGFNANFTIDECPRNCSGNGRCENGQCICNKEHFGFACHLEYCPKNCSSSVNRSNGVCVLQEKKCVCHQGFSGSGCTLSSNSQYSSVGWHLLDSGGRGPFTPRSGHAVAYLPFTDQLYTFGGRNFSHVFDDFLVYNFVTSEWVTLKTQMKPAARWGHAMAHHADTIVLFGGELSDSSLSNEFWVYNVQKQEWSLEEHDPSGVPPPRVAFHTLTMIEQKLFILFGGRIDGGEFSNGIYKLILGGSKPRWELIEPAAGNPIRVVGHSATYHAESKSILVYGGVVADLARFSKLSSNLYAFNVEKRHWTQLHFPLITKHHSSSYIKEHEPPLERAFHTSTIAGNYLVIFAGYMHRHNVQEKCYDDQIYLYHLKCHKWVNYDVISSNTNFRPRNVKDKRKGQRGGVYSHAMALRRGSTLLILGGYSGYMRGDLRALQLPETITHITSETAATLCGYHNESEAACKENPACGWCPGPRPMCMDRNKKADCGSAFSSGSCPGLCPALHDCQSCMAWGEGQEITNHVMVDAGGFMPRSCGWCVSSSQCHSLNEPPLLCRTSENKTLEQAEGYWGNHGYVVTNQPECRSHNYKPGLTLVQYNSPINLDLPDELVRVNSSAARLTMFLDQHVMKLKASKVEGVARILGYLHPSGVTFDASSSMPRLFIRSGFNAQLWLSLDDKEANLELVATHAANNANLTEAIRPTFGAKLIPILGKGARYLLNMEISLICDKSAHRNCYNYSEIKWCPQQSKNTCHHFALIPMKYLEPYKNGTDCKKKTSCLACLVDAACGWCASKKTCVPRSGDADVCPAAKDQELLVLEPEQCINCAYHIYCESCLSDSNCEWAAEEAVCVRKGRDPSAVKTLQSCPESCHLRKGCQSCLGDPGRCAWCEQTQTCFLFSTYLTSYMYGGCRQWFDEDLPRFSKSKSSLFECPECGRHSDCKSCLAQLGCGWCGNINNPNLGICTSGDFASPYNATCNDIVSEGNEVVDGPAEWSYEKCPNVDECRLGLAECHHNATCKDTEDSYVCVCNKGYKGDGKLYCNKTCAEDCNNGRCSEAPDYKCICDIGWTGEFCNVDCGCNFHATCTEGVGRCDECKNNTAGPRCDRCTKGSYGDATRLQGCDKCDCNGHGDPENDFCDPVTGDCHCIHNTQGKRCGSCAPGFYGYPRDNGICYKDCTDHKPVLTEPSGALGSRKGSNLHPQHCLWIIKGQQHSTVILTISSSLFIKCPENHVYVYEGLFSTNSPGQLLGSFCGTNLDKDIVVASKTNQLSVYYRRSKVHEGFNASYRQIWCPDSCHDPNRYCEDGLCICKSGLTGPTCLTKLCPKGCSANAIVPNKSLEPSGTCDMGYSKVCRCNGNLGGDACDVHLDSNRSVVWSLLYDVERVFSGDTLLSPDFVGDSPPDVQFGHSLLVSEPSKHLWLFGGVSQMDHHSNRLYIYDKDFNRWKKVNVSHEEGRIPSPRRHHCAAMVGMDMYVYGGMNEQFSALGDFWKFATDLLTWTTISTSPDVPPLVGCTLTNIHNKHLLLIGGYSPENGFQDKTLVYTISETAFKTFNTTGAAPEGIYGHTAEYHSATDCIYVFGGIVYEGDGPRLSSTLWVLHVASREWSRVPADERVNPRFNHISARFLHCATLINDMMVIIGGRNSSGEAILESYVYNINCNSWIPLEGYYVRVNGTPPASFSSGSCVNLNSQVFLYGGSSNQPQGFLYKVTIPEDVCQLFYHDRVGCLNNVGCSYCSTSTTLNVTSVSSLDRQNNNDRFCFNTANEPKLCSERRASNVLSTANVDRGQTCSADWLSNRSCSQFENCMDCVAKWPGIDGGGGGLQQPVCQWCADCLKGRCIRAGEGCPTQSTPECKVPPDQPLVVTRAEKCPQRSCVASECEKCRDLGKCMWTRQVLRSGELRHVINQTPTYHWTCVSRAIKKQANHPVESNPPRPCPKRCGSYTNCTTCLESTGGEGGWHQCYWASSLGQCITPSYAPIRCEGGMCGPLLQGSSAICSPACHLHSQSKLCLADPRCGWCALLVANGRGLCMEGSKNGPTGGSCQNGTVFLNGHPLPGDVPKWLQTHGSNVGWYYFKKPMENECTNDHHDCDPQREQCVDKDDGYECICQQGYTLDADSGQCLPVCRQGCVYGECVRPDTCLCSFGYVGANCSIHCDCNGHSNCAGPDRLSDCIECKNNTQGKQCNECMTGFVGNPTNGGKCISCFNYCHRHTSYCMDPKLMSSLDDATLMDLDKMIKLALSYPGPLETAVCLNCSHNTTGETCDKCQDGFFEQDGDIKNGCRPCDCHGHGDRCDPKTGEDCNCRNNTETDRSCTPNSRNKHASCWSLQCAKCKDNFQGIPVNGHQCYRHMRLEQDYCIDPENQGECNPDPSPLPYGGSVFFVVQPRYMNVNIRIIVDITAGEVDLYLAAKEDTFVVNYNRSTGIHQVLVDPKYEVFTEEVPVPPTLSPPPPTSSPKFNKPSSSHHRREAPRANSLPRDPGGFQKYASNPPLDYGGSKPFLMMVKKPATGLTTYVEVEKPHHFLVINNLRNRLILTIPQNVYDLRSTRLYLVIGGGAESSYGNLFFRQDQTRIDLFVFFSVFFSCFFLFLSMCVVVWKVKQGLDLRRARRLQAAEMQHMASRPFSKIFSTMYTMNDIDDLFLLPASPVTNNKTPRPRKSSKSQVHQSNTPKVTRAFEGRGAQHPGGTLRPVSVEPTSDNQAAVTTMLIHLPGGTTAPVHLCIGSALTTIRGTMQTRC